MRIGMVCPYSFDVPGGVQFHIRDLAEYFLAGGHEVGVLAPADDDTPVPEYVTSAGHAIPVKYNGSVARVTFGPVSAARVRRWLAEGEYDLVHIHEPITPSLSVLALWAATGPVVATCHTATERSRAMQVAHPLMRPSIEKISARIAVSEDARRTMVEHLGGDAVVIPNGVYVDRFAQAAINPDWQGTADAPTFAFVGRLDEPRKGFGVLTQAIPTVLQRYRNARFLVVGRGDASEYLDDLGSAADSVQILGSLDDAAKASVLRSADVYVAPHTGGESFGIVLVEAMSAGAAVVASDLGAFRRVLGEGKYGALVPVDDPAELARELIATVADQPRRQAQVEAARQAVRRYNWPQVAAEILEVYDMVRTGTELVPRSRRARGRLVRSVSYTARVMGSVRVGGLGRAQLPSDQHTESNSNPNQVTATSDGAT